VFDRRFSVVSDPVDPDGPFFPFNDDGFPRSRTTWIDHGVLKTLSVGAGYAEEKHLPGVIDNPVSCRLLADGPSTTVEDMIATTKRGVYVTRTGGLTFSDFRTLLFTGVTRDGLWLIENGKITKPIKNFRFSESPFFFLNNLEQVGTPRLVPVSGRAEFVLPPVKVRDFNFISLADAI
jgi:predicted Zn-dependent protease